MDKVEAAYNMGRFERKNHALKVERAYMAQNPPRPSRPKFGAQALSTFVPHIVEPVLAQRGFVSAALLTQWAEIVGPHIARWTTPLEIRWPKLPQKGENSEPTIQKSQAAGRMAVLVIACPGAFALDVKAAELRIVEAVNQRFGWACIASIRISQTPRPAPKTIPALKTLPSNLVAAISDGLGDIKEDALRHSLARLGAAITLKEETKKAKEP